MPTSKRGVSLHKEDMMASNMAFIAHVLPFTAHVLASFNLYVIPKHALQELEGPY